MYQPKVKLEFVKRYCSPTIGWKVFVDIDPSELGNTGGKRKSRDACNRQREMRAEGADAVHELLEMGVAVGGIRDGGTSRAGWHSKHGLENVHGDRDIVAVNDRTQKFLICEVEGSSSGQPEQKLYKAVGQIVGAAGGQLPKNYELELVIAVSGERLAKAMERMTALSKIGITGISIGATRRADRVVFGESTLFG